MELDKILTPWIEQLESAFKPYPEFVESVATSLQEISETQNALFIALAHADLETTRLNQLVAAHAEAQAAAMATAMADEPGEEQFQAFVVEIATLKSQLQSQVSELQSKQVQLETLKVQLEEQLDARRVLQAQVDDVQSEVAQKTEALALVHSQLQSAGAAHSEISERALAEARAQIDEKNHLIEEAQAQIRSMHETQLDAAAALETHARDLAYAQEEIQSLKTAQANAVPSNTQFDGPSFDEEPAQDHTHLQQELDDTRTMLQSHDRALKDARAQIESLKSAIEAAKAERDSHSQDSVDHSVREQRARSPRVSQPKGPALPERKVLLVDDAEINRVLMSHYFKGLPVKLHFAISVNAALQKCKENQYDLVVVDDELQDLDQPELTQNSQKLVALSNSGNGLSVKHPEIQHVLNRGQSREEFVQQLKSFLWTA